MKIQFKKFGVIEQGELELNNLTLFCGPNNTGKTYVMYCLYDLLDKNLEINFSFVEKIIDQLVSNQVVLYNIEELINNDLDNILLEMSQALYKDLPNLFGTEIYEFKQTKIKLDVDKNKIRTNIIDSTWHSRSSLGNRESGWFLDIIKEKNDTNMILTIRDIGIPMRFLTETISSNIAHLIFNMNYQSCFLLPAERSGLNLFFKELSSIRNRLLHHAQRDTINPMEVLKDIVNSRYAKPVSDYIEFLNKLTNNKKQKSEYNLQVQFIQKDVINGKYQVDRYGDILFCPYRSDGKKMPLHFSSSTVKTLFGLVFYLEHQAKVGDYLMIDEPELSLHPDNQRNLARVIAALVNNGIKVVVSTHSTYFVRELNNLIMLNQRFAEADTLRKHYGYKPNESLDPNLVSSYLFADQTIKPMEIDPKEGIIAKTFDQVINNLNQSSNDIYYAAQEGEDLDVE
jgi:predicted ATPase